MIPEFNRDGLLPVGVHDADMAEVIDRFCRFRESDRRPRLCKSLEPYIREISNSGIACEVLLDGSFVTTKAAPNDIDLLVVLRSDYGIGDVLNPSTRNLISRYRVQERFGFDILVARAASPEYREYVAYFTQLREDPAKQKGLVRVKI